MRLNRSVWWAIILAVVMCFLVSSPWSIARAGDNGGTALDFDGTDQVVITETASVQHLGLTGFTFEAWIWLPYWHSGSIIRNDNDYHLLIIAGRLDADVFPLGVGGDGIMHRETANELLPTAAWTHVAAVSDTTGIRLYVNGNLVDSSSQILDYSGPEDPLWLGRDQRFDNGFHGAIDDVRMWNTARTQAQIQSDMFRELPGTPSGLISYWKFDEGSGDFTADSSGLGNDGTLSGTVHSPVWVNSTAPMGNLNAAYQTGMAGMWAGVANTASDAITTGLNIANVSFLNDTGDDIIFGHNGQIFSCCVTANLATTPHAQKRWARLWELDVNDQVGTTGGTVDLAFDISDAGGTGSFNVGGNYYLLKRPVGSALDFEETTFISSSVSGDQVTFRVSVAELGSEFTLGADQDSPTALETTALTARTSSGIPVAWMTSVLLVVFGAALGLGYRTRRKQA